jgi:hypothetical protein
MKNTILIIGILAVLIGILWVGQGLGIIKWPAQSFMISQTQWSVYGGCLALAGLMMIWFARR